ncbi:capsular biosynthesis protein [Ferrimonas pelagia]|uniref:Capsular biosynthesis protein n=1 Tax=Ferrimonas pelagia TaxID=1177826 RepID=A0ABP9F6D7_9GAMM
MYLITSAAYIPSELQSEFGHLPPSFLPVGNRRLFHHQIERIPAGERIVLTLPQQFQPGPYDQAFLQKRGIELLFLPEHLSLGESVVYALNLLEFDAKETLTLLHGDTLFEQLPSGSDKIGISPVEENYNWTCYDPSTGLLRPSESDNGCASDWIINGYFSFSEPKSLVRHIVSANWDFIQGINGYHAELPLIPESCDDWYDFGHGHTYYQSKSQMTTQRAFNDMQIRDQVVTKSSLKKQKLAAEAHWYQTLPGPMRLYTPQLLEAVEHDERFTYSIEYLHLTALNELYVFSLLPAKFWDRVLRACCRFIHHAQQFPVESGPTLGQLFGQKTAQRLAEYGRSATIDLAVPLRVNGQQHLSIYELAQASESALPADNRAYNVLHGDLCFSNILYDFRTGSIKVIDPRGLDLDNNLSIHGNSLYDLAKLAHSIIGLYDVIIAGYFNASQHQQELLFSITENSVREQVMASFCQMVSEQFGVTPRALYAMQIQLFLSMLPLHSDRPDRQLGFIGNAYRLYDLMEALEK